MKSLLLGILVIIIVGIGGLVYRNAVEHPAQSIVCPLDATVCPDGTSVSRTGTSCTFPACPAPNVSLPAPVSISFAAPTDLSAGGFPDEATVAEYANDAATSKEIVIRRFEVSATSTSLATIQQTAINNTSGAPVSVTSFTSTVLGTHRFTVVTVERFEGFIDTAYYLARANDVLRFDAIDRGVANWTDPNLNISALPAHSALAKLLATLQGG